MQRNGENIHDIKLNRAYRKMRNNRTAKTESQYNGGLVYVYLSSCSIQGLSYTCVVLSNFFFSEGTLFAIITFFFQSIPSVYTSLRKTTFLYRSGKVEPHAIAARSCGRSSPIT